MAAEAPPFVPGTWSVRIAALVSDYELLSLEGAIVVGP
jgi:hypothetical protein